jgi:hypothetical protein
MADYEEPPRHKFVVGIHNPEIPNPWEYALDHDFDFACVFISRSQLQQEVASLSPDSREFNAALFRNALLRPSGSAPSIQYTDKNRSYDARARPCIPLA